MFVKNSSVESGMHCSYSSFKCILTRSCRGRPRTCFYAFSPNSAFIDSDSHNETGVKR